MRVTQTAFNANNLAVLALARPASASATAGSAPAILGIPVDFILFAFTLVGVAMLRQHTLRVALTGLAAITLCKLLLTGFKTGAGVAGLRLHFAHVWVILANLLGLLLGFALLSKHFAESRIPASFQQHAYSPIAKDVAPGLPVDWTRLGIVALILAAAIIANIIVNNKFKHLNDSFPFIGAAV